MLPLLLLSIYFHYLFEIIAAPLLIGFVPFWGYFTSYKFGGRVMEELFSIFSDCLLPTTLLDEKSTSLTIAAIVSLLVSVLVKKNCRFFFHS